MSLHLNVNNPERGEVWLVSFDPSRGEEIQKLRPAVVVNPKAIGRLGLRIVVPITEWSTKYRDFIWMVPLIHGPASGLIKLSVADSSQVKSISVQRFRSKIGVVTPDELNEIVAAIALCVGYNP